MNNSLDTTFNVNDLTFTPVFEQTGKHLGVVMSAKMSEITDHQALTGRDEPNQHPMTAIAGLVDALANVLSEGDIPEWAMQETKPVYAPEEIGAEPAGTAEAVARETLEVATRYTDTKIAAIPDPNVDGKIFTHNTASVSHNDIRLLVSGLTERLNALANSDDETLDQMAEVVEYIKDNRDLIEQITTGKVSVTDIVNNLTTNVSNKPLSAAQGVALKSSIDSLNAELKNKLSKSDRSSIVSDSVTIARSIYAFPAYDSPSDFGCTNSNSLAYIVSVMPNNSDCDFWVNTYTYYNVYNEILAQATKYGATDGYGTVILRKRNSLVNVEWRHYKTTLTLSRRWSATNNVGWARDWFVTITADGEIKNGKDGYTPVKGIDYFDGEDGYTPVRGTDYWTEADKQEILSKVSGAVGGAPAGYGLGLVGGKALTSSDDINNIKEAGFYSWYSSAPANAFESYMSMTVYGMNAYDVTQACYCMSRRKYYMVVRHCNSSVWGEWEWVNPPMYAGVEYRTTERYNGKPVYVKMVDCGTWANEKTVTWNTNDAVRPISYTACNGGAVLPYGDGTTYIRRVDMSSINLGGTSDPWGGNVRVTIKYYKTTD